MTSLKHWIWILPFICFFGSYFAFHCFFAPNTLATPTLMGKQLPEAIQLLSDTNLNMRILSQKEDHDLPPGTILSQIPSANSSIRPHQSLFVVISKQVEQKQAPNFLQKKSDTCYEIAEKHAIVVKTYEISHLIENICIGQLPGPNQPLIDNRITLYISKGSSKPSLLPSFKKRSLEEVASFLTENSIKYSVIHAKPIDTQHTCKNCVISQQKPLAGSLIDLKKPLTIQLFVQ